MAFLSAQRFAIEGRFMSDATTPAGAAPAKKSKSLQSLVYGVVAVIAIVVGVSKVWQGISTMLGWDGSAEFQTLLEQSDAAYREAIAQADIAEPLYASLMEALNAQSLEDARLEQGDNAKQAAAAFKEGAKQFGISGKKIDEALQLGLQIKDEHTKSLTLRSQACALLADVCQLNADLCEAMLDASIATKEALVPKLAALAEKRDAARTQAEAALVESQKLAEQDAPK
jgi:hypothetical protein